MLLLFCATKQLNSTKVFWMDIAKDLRYLKIYINITPFIESINDKNIFILIYLHQFPLTPSLPFQDAFAPFSRENLETDCTSLLGLPSDTPPDVFRTILKFVYYGERIKSPKLATLSLIFAKRMLMHDFQVW